MNPISNPLWLSKAIKLTSAARTFLEANYRTDHITAGTLTSAKLTNRMLTFNTNDYLKVNFNSYD